MPLPSRAKGEITTEKDYIDEAAKGEISGLGIVLANLAFGIARQQKLA
jgi:hypothetical protein